jgi:negative regulator of sigma E activity
MSEQLKESLSAALDDAADEFELRRVLDETRRNDALRDTFGRYQLVKSVLRGETSAQTLRHRQELQKRIRESFEEETPADLEDEETPVQVEPVPGKSRWSVRIGATAATFVAVLAVYFVGFNPDSTQLEPLVAEGPNVPLDTTVVSTDHSTGNSADIDAQTNTGADMRGEAGAFAADRPIDSGTANTAAGVVIRHAQLLERHRTGSQHAMAPADASPSVQPDGVAP